MKKRMTRIVAIALALVLCLSIMPVKALAIDLVLPNTATGQRLPGTTNQYNDPTHGNGPNTNNNGRRPFHLEREPAPEEPEEPAKEPEKQPEKQPEKPQEDPGRIVTERFIKLIETGRGFEELWSNRESPVWTLGDIENYLARRAGRIPTAGVGFVAHH